MTWKMDMEKGKAIFTEGGITVEHDMNELIRALLTAWNQHVDQHLTAAPEGTAA